MAKYNPIVQNRIARLIKNISGEFEISKISKSPARFSRQKLEWFNAYYIKMLSQTEFLFRCLDLSVRRQIGILWQNPSFEKIDHQKSDFQNPDWQSKMNLIYQILLSQNGMENNLSVSHSEFSLENLDPQKSLEKDTFEFGFSSLILAMHLDQNRIIKLDQSGVCWNGTLAQTKNFKGFLDNAEYRPENTDLNIKEIDYETTPDSWCILCYQKPTSFKTDNNGSQYDDSILRWKKDTLETSIQNLATIWQLIAPALEEIETQKAELRMQIIQDLKNRKSTNFKPRFEYLTGQIEDIIKSEMTAREMDFGSYLWPLRVCLSGKKKSPSPFELMAVLTRSEIEQRISAVVNL